MSSTALLGRPRDPARPASGCPGGQHRQRPRHLTWASRRAGQTLRTGGCQPIRLVPRQQRLVSLRLPVHWRTRRAPWMRRGRHDPAPRASAAPGPSGARRGVRSPAARAGQLGAPPRGSGSRASRTVTRPCRALRPRRRHAWGAGGRAARPGGPSGAPDGPVAPPHAPRREHGHTRPSQPHRGAAEPRRTACARAGAAFVRPLGRGRLPRVPENYGWSAQHRSASLASSRPRSVLGNLRPATLAQLMPSETGESIPLAQRRGPPRPVQSLVRRPLKFTWCCAPATSAQTRQHFR